LKLDAEDIHRRVKSKKNLVKVTILLPVAASHGFGAESVWAEAIDHGTMRILNTPFFAKGISYGDDVSIEVESGELRFVSILRKSGHSSYRILLSEGANEGDFKTKWSELAALGCTYESFKKESMRLYAVDVPPSADIHDVYALLEIGENERIWDFEEGDYAPAHQEQ
jgi:hypothetical protein